MRARRSTTLGEDYARRWWAGPTRDVATNRPRVLLESADGAEATALWRTLDRNGYRMQWCPGPDQHANRRCPLVASGSCALLDNADVVISHLDFTCAASRETLAALQNSSRAADVVVAAPTFVRAQHPEIVDASTTMVEDHLTGHRVLTAVRGVLQHS